MENIKWQIEKTFVDFLYKCYANHCQPYFFRIFVNMYKFSSQHKRENPNQRRPWKLQETAKLKNPRQKKRIETCSIKEEGYNSMQVSSAEPTREAMTHWWILFLCQHSLSTQCWIIYSHVPDYDNMLADSPVRLFPLQWLISMGVSLMSSTQVKNSFTCKIDMYIIRLLGLIQNPLTYSISS